MARSQPVLLSAVLRRHYLHGTPQMPDAMDTLPFFKEMSSVTISGVTASSSLRRGADKSLARPTYLRRRTESIVSFERGVRSCTELQVFTYYTG